MVSDNYYVGVNRVGEGGEITNTILVEMAIRDELPVQFRFYAAWELTDKTFAEEQNFQKFLENEAMKFRNPLTVSFQL